MSFLWGSPSCAARQPVLEVAQVLPRAGEGRVGGCQERFQIQLRLCAAFHTQR